MLYRKILINIFGAFLAPFILMASSLPAVYDAVFYQRYRYHDFQISTTKEFLHAVYGQPYIPLFIISLILLFLPFQLIKDYYRKEGKNKMLTFLRKWILLTLIMSCWIVFWGFFTNIWWFPIYKNLVYIPYAAGFSLIFSTFFHYLLDRYEDRDKLKIREGYDKNRND